jgi:hypothetical protein
MSYLDIDEVIVYAVDDGYVSTNQKYKIIELVLIKEWIRRKFKTYIENSLEERGSMNHKTKEYYTICFRKRTPPHKPGIRYNNSTSYSTCDSYESALKESIMWVLEYNNK